MNRPPANDREGALHGRYGQQLGPHWRMRERPYPGPSSQLCAVLEYFFATTGWTPVFVFRPDGQIARAADGNIATFAPEPP